MASPLSPPRELCLITSEEEKGDALADDNEEYASTGDKVAEEVTEEQPSRDPSSRDFDQGDSEAGKLKFHSVHGTNIKIEQGGSHVVKEKKNEYGNGIVFSHRPISIDERVCFRVTGRVDEVICMHFGVTNIDPASLKSEELPRCTSSFHSESGYWLNQIRSKSEVRIVQFIITSDGDLHYSIDGEYKGIFLSGIDTSIPLWVIIDVYGMLEAVEFVDLPEQKEEDGVDDEEPTEHRVYLDWNEQKKEERSGMVISTAVDGQVKVLCGSVMIVAERQPENPFGPGCWVNFEMDLDTGENWIVGECEPKYPTFPYDDDTFLVLAPAIFCLEDDMHKDDYSLAYSPYFKFVEDRLNLLAEVHRRGFHGWIEVILGPCTRPDARFPLQVQHAHRTMECDEHGALPNQMPTREELQAVKLASRRDYNGVDSSDVNRSRAADRSISAWLRAGDAEESYSSPSHAMGGSFVMPSISEELSHVANSRAHHHISRVLALLDSTSETTWTEPPAATPSSNTSAQDSLQLRQTASGTIRDDILARLDDMHVDDRPAKTESPVAPSGDVDTPDDVRLGESARLATYSTEIEKEFSEIFIRFIGPQEHLMFAARCEYQGEEGLIYLTPEKLFFASESEHSALLSIVALCDVHEVLVTTDDDLMVLAHSKPSMFFTNFGVGDLRSTYESLFHAWRAIREDDREEQPLNGDEVDQIQDLERSIGNLDEVEEIEQNEEEEENAVEEAVEEENAVEEAEEEENAVEEAVEEENAVEEAVEEESAADTSSNEHENKPMRVLDSSDGQSILDYLKATETDGQYMCPLAEHCAGKGTFSSISSVIDHMCKDRHWTMKKGSILARCTDCDKIIISRSTIHTHTKLGPDHKHFEFYVKEGK